MEIIGSVIHTEMFTAKKTGKTYTKLFVPVSSGITEVIANGDLTALSGCADVPFRLVCRDGGLKLYYDGEEEE